MKAFSLRARSAAAVALVAIALSAAPALAGTPLVCFPVDIGEAPSIPWGRDPFTLWHLLAVADEAGRGRVFDRLAALSPPPEGVTRAGCVERDPAQLRAWKEHLAQRLSRNARPLIAARDRAARRAGLRAGFACPEPSEADSFSASQDWW